MLMQQLPAFDPSHASRSPVRIDENAESGIHISTGRPMPSNRGSSTPTTVNGWPLTDTGRPMTPESAPKYTRQVLSLMTSGARRLPGWSSSLDERRPELHRDAEDVKKVRGDPDRLQICLRPAG